MLRVFLQGYIRLMKCEIEITDDYEDWWSTLTELEQIDITAIIGLLEIKGVTLQHIRTAQESMALNTRICANLEFNIVAILIGCCMRLIRVEALFY